MVNINVPEGARLIIGRLEEAGFEAFVVGGCVRDSLLGLAPKDWDVCTAALPNVVSVGYSRSKLSFIPGSVTLKSSSP